MRAFLENIHSHIFSSWGIVAMIFSGVLLLVSMVGVHHMVYRLPHDYFVRDHPPKNKLRRVIQNLVGGILIVLGLIMLITPGQGILTILMGVMLTNFPKKTQTIKKLLHRGKLKNTLNRLRQKAGQKPFVF
jgi:uncharacterized membrane protein SpoIIM required for sporulation